MTDKLHNHIAEMVCETDEPGKSADVTAARPLDEQYDTMGEVERNPHGAWSAIQTLAAALAELTARAEAAEARVAELTAKLEAPVQVDAAHIRAAALREALAIANQHDYSIMSATAADHRANMIANAIDALIGTASPLPDKAIAWMGMESAPKGEITESVGCRGVSEWFLGQVSPEFRDNRPPFIVIRRRAWPQGDGWECAGEAYYVPSFFDAWAELSATLSAPSPDVGVLVVPRYSSYEIMWAQDGHVPETRSDGEWVRYIDHATATTDAVKAERERCAKLVSEYPERREKAGFDWRKEIQSAFDRSARALAAQEGGE